MDALMCDHSEVPDLVSQLTCLMDCAFAEYDGAMTFSEAWTAWYLRRPGYDAHMSKAVLAGERMVANVLVSVQDLRQRGEVLRCGIIDAVATDPDYRRRGLARALMQNAQETMQHARLDAAVLYTNPEGHPYGFYETLGYREHARLALLAGPRPTNSACAAQRVDAGAEADGLCALLNEYFASWDGFAALDEDAWRWHRLDAPEAPVVIAEMTGRGPATTVTFAAAELLLAGQRRRVSVAYDLAADVLNVDQVRSLLSAAPESWVCMTLDETAPERHMVEAVGLSPQVSEAAMVLPFTAGARSALTGRRSPWYPMIESVIGV